jgi:hypothetical protein
VARVLEAGSGHEEEIPLDSEDGGEEEAVIEAAIEAVIEEAVVVVVVVVGRPRNQRTPLPRQGRHGNEQ